VRLHGTGGGTIHYNDTTVEELSMESIAADAVLGMAVEIEKGGMEQLVADLIEIGVSESATLSSDPDLLGFATTRVASAGRADAAVALVEKIYLDDQIPFRHIVPIEIARDNGRLNESAIRRIVEAIAAPAPNAEDGPAAEFYYNAGNMIRRFDTPRGLELHDLAAERNPDYKKRPYWWTDRGRMLFALGDLPSAADAYAEADRMGDESATPLLADSLAMMGQYEHAVAVWERMQNGTRFIWGLKAMALGGLMAELGITSQTRHSHAAEKLFQENAAGVEVLKLDALHVLGLWRAGVEHRDPDQPGFSAYYVATAAFAVNSPLFYFEALVAVQGEYSDPAERAPIEHYIIVTAVQECGDEFRRFLLEDDHVYEEAREQLLELVDSIKLPETDKFVVRGDGKDIEF
jgi:tetratricopeptide (TPR) repeat protein